MSLREQRALAALVTHGNVRAAAIASQVSERSLFRFMQRPAFRARLAELHEQTYAGTLVRAEYLASRALRALEDILEDPTASPRDRIAAAREVLSLAHRGFESNQSPEAGETSARSEAWPR